MIGKLKTYNFIGLKKENNDPKEQYVSAIMKEVERGGENYNFFKEKLDKELGFKEENCRGIYYPTMVKYLALALEEIENAATTN